MPICDWPQRNNITKSDAFAQNILEKDYTSATAHCMNDLDSILRLEYVVGKGAARDNLLIDLHRKASACQCH